MGGIILGTNNEVGSNIMGVPWAMEHPKVVQVMVQGGSFFLGNGFTSWKTITLGKIIDNPSPYFFKILSNTRLGVRIFGILSVVEA